MNITTTYKTNGTGVGVIVAKGAGKQRTTKYDHALSINKNHGAAAGTLASVLGWKDSDTLVHVQTTDQKHSFSNVSV